jgi:hypothetical protein
LDGLESEGDAVVEGGFGGPAFGVAVVRGWVGSKACGELLEGLGEEGVMVEGEELDAGMEGFGCEF